MTGGAAAAAADAEHDDEDGDDKDNDRDDVGKTQFGPCALAAHFLQQFLGLCLSSAAHVGLMLS